MYKLLPTEDDIELFFRMNGENAKKYGQIGYFRCHFGSNGKEFQNTWFDIQNDLKIDDFRKEFEYIINFLRFEGDNPAFASRKNLELFYISSPCKDLFDRGRGYLIRTKKYSYYFRLLPNPGDYDIYCFTYDNYFLLPEISEKHKIPDYMWTICWTGAVNDEGEVRDGCERWETRGDVIARADTLVRECGVCEENLFIFPPEADGLKIPYGEFENY